MNEKINILISIFHMFGEFRERYTMLTFLDYIINRERIYIKNPYISKYRYYPYPSRIEGSKQAVLFVKTMPPKRMFESRDFIRKRRTRGLTKN